jgi:hypothetical protein
VNHGKTHPDSVNRVNPPKTTIPNTLTALPTNQYATAFELFWGQEKVDFRAAGAAGIVIFLGGFPALSLSPSELNGVFEGAVA